MDRQHGGGTPAFDVGPALDGGAWGAWAKGVIALVASAIVLDGFDNQVLGFAVPVLLREWHVTREALAPVFALGFVGMVIGTIVGGALGDRFGRRPALIGSVLVFALATGATALMHDVTGLGLCRTIAGFGLGGAMPCAATLLAEFAPVRRRALAVTIGIVCVPLGGVVGGLIAARVLPVFGWQALFAAGGVLPLVVVALLLALLPESPRFLVDRPARWPELARLLVRLGHRIDGATAFVDSHERAEVKRASIRALFRDGFALDSAALWLSFFACLLTVYLIFSWAPTLLGQSGFGIALASEALAIFNIGGVAGALAAALAIPRTGSRAVMLLSAAGGVVGAVALGRAAGGGHGAILALLAIEGAFINAVQTCLYALSAQLYPARLRSTGVGAAAGFGRIGAIVSSFVGAAVLAAGWASFFAAIAIGMGVAFLGLMTIRRHIPRTAIAAPEA